MEKTYRLPFKLATIRRRRRRRRWRRWRRYGEQTKGEETTKTFTQEELDKIVADRLARDEKSTLKNTAITTILKRNSLNTKDLLRKNV
ncbi:hypothetical protein P7H06_25475 [Paenibacillus larvae]|nr:hypothetical protein [Paenibacillus larvae]MDT2262169.1 hypothetical protein [Paenibacillus larvae]